MTQVVAGRGTGYGSGVLLYCPGTGRYLFVRRSDQGDQGGTWCCPGGGVEDYETVDEAARREAREEIGYDYKGPLVHMARDNQGDFTFHNHFGFVPEEFEPQLNGEHTEYQWSEEFPDNLHPGLKRSLHNWLERQGTLE